MSDIEVCICGQQKEMRHSCPPGTPRFTREQTAEHNRLKAEAQTRPLEEKNLAPINLRKDDFFYRYIQEWMEENLESVLIEHQMRKNLKIPEVEYNLPTGLEND